MAGRLVETSKLELPPYSSSLESRPIVSLVDSLCHTMEVQKSSPVSYDAAADATQPAQLIEPSTESSTGPPVLSIDIVGSAPVLSKNAQKRLLKQQRRDELKKERRAREKAAKKEKRKRMHEEDEAKAVEGGGEEVKPVNKKRKLEGGDGAAKEEKRPFGAKVVIDLGFDDKMTDREIISLTSQLAYCYSSNRKSAYPFSSLIYTSLNGRTKERLDMLGTYGNWKGVEWWGEGYEHLWEEEKGTEGERVYTCPVTGTSRTRSGSDREKVVYLTADSDAELLELNPEETYVIGGIVDKNRYKSLCQHKALSSQIRTARLPIGVYLKELPTRKVLTVNQVLDILLKWIEHRDWRKALFDVVPMRKFHSEGKASRRAKAKSSSAGDEDSRKDEEADGTEEENEG